MMAGQMKRTDEGWASLSLRIVHDCPCCFMSYIESEYGQQRRETWRGRTTVLQASPKLLISQLSVWLSAVSSNTRMSQDVYLNINVYAWSSCVQSFYRYSQIVHFACSWNGIIIGVPWPIICGRVVWGGSRYDWRKRGYWWSSLEKLLVKNTLVIQLLSSLYTRFTVEVIVTFSGYWPSCIIRTVRHLPTNQHVQSWRFRRATWALLVGLLR